MRKFLYFFVLCYDSMVFYEKKNSDTSTAKVQTGHRSRLREKFLNAGLEGFLNYEIIELLLTLGTPRKDCKQSAKNALIKFKTLGGVLEASSEQLLEIKGIGVHNVFGLKLIQEVSRKFLREKMLARAYCRSSKEVFDYLYHSLRDSKREKFKVLFLDAKNQILEEKTVFEGTVDSSAVYPREIIKEALLRAASSLIFVHNHPSGDPAPSESDKEITTELVFASNVVQIRVLDHLIIGNNRYFSFADSGLLSECESTFQLKTKKTF
ncbi:DNA repair protein RadC [Acidobacteriota bacterium]